MINRLFRKIFSNEISSPEVDEDIASPQDEILDDESDTVERVSPITVTYDDAIKNFVYVKPDLDGSPQWDAIPWIGDKSLPVLKKRWNNHPNTVLVLINYRSLIRMMYLDMGLAATDRICMNNDLSYRMLLLASLSFTSVELVIPPNNRATAKQSAKLSERTSVDWQYSVGFDVMGSIYRHLQSDKVRVVGISVSGLSVRDQVISCTVLQ